jgi:adenylate kinase
LCARSDGFLELNSLRHFPGISVNEESLGSSELANHSLGQKVEDNLEGDEVTLLQVGSGSARGAELLAIMEKGDLVPLQVVLDLLAEAMISKLGGSKGFLIDGYPREVSQGVEFEKAIAPCAQILYFQVSDETMTGRLLKRGETSGRADDNVETIKKRLDTFHQHSEPVMDAYASKCAKIPAERAVDDIFADVCSALDKL